MQAIILAAGSGLRLRDFHVLPKGFLKIGDDYLIKQSIQHLNHYGISDILIVTGYGFEHYNQLVNHYASVTTQHNPLFQKYASLYSLYLAKKWVKDEVIILESDILYENRALNSLINSSAADAIIVSGFTQSGDEVYVSAKNKQLVDLSKNTNMLLEPSLMGEFVGLTKLSLPSFQSLIEKLEKNTELLQQGHYDEHGLVELSSQHAIECILITDLLWAEVDNREHFIRAQAVWQKIHAKELA